MIRRVAYLCMQATREGQASYAHVNEIINGLRRHGVEVDLYEPYWREGDRPPGLLGKAWGYLTVQCRLIFCLRRYDLLYIRSHFMAGLAIWGARALGVPQVHEVNGPLEDLYVMYPWTRRLDALLSALTRSQRRMAAAIIAVTPQMAAWCAKGSGNPNVHVVPNGANLDLFHPGARHPEAPSGSYAIFFGSFSPWQGIDTMLEAVKSPEWPAGTRLVLAGDGAEQAKVEAAAAADDRVVYLGVKAYRDLPGFVAPAAVGLCVKDDGGNHANTGWSPLKLYEMMAVGIPVVVTDLPGQFEVVERAQAGLVIKPGDATALARAVARLVNEPGERLAMGRRGHEHVSREHSWDRRSLDTLDILQSVMKGAAKA
ncbi:glycosyltransferase family 4 protein [Geothrix oryzisoli]|uniref:glycosyltransferase family 4 protein n=1 Tax=Geothrix oryzisoli TaxID=2922721 RepID=UPI001FABF91A|nr:glycosyltransferase family 4 protein [Geothrix oryzisoli]